VTLAPGQRIELRIERLAAGGEGVAHCEGMAVFVPSSAPGDRVLARITDLRARFARAEIVEILAPGPGRREPPCPYAERCGGCDWLHLDEDTQLAARVEILASALTRIGGLAGLPGIEVLRSPRALGYRARARVAHGGGRIGFRARRSSEIVDVERCAVLVPEAQRELERLRAAPPAGEGEREIRGFDARAAGLDVRAQAFFQANAALWEAWPQQVGELCGTGELALELYAGVGFFTVQLERRFARVVAVEGAPSALDLARNTRAEVFHMSVERFARSELAKQRPDVVLLNPPRGGCAHDVVERLRGCAPRLVYVSCDPATLARDLAKLGGVYRVARLIAVDAFPQTHHVEAIAMLDIG
jgi:23S rRNA (uracil1939-C5)-methyltransferase